MSRVYRFRKEVAISLSDNAGQSVPTFYMSEKHARELSKALLLHAQGLKKGEHIKTSEVPA